MEEVSGTPSVPGVGDVEGARIDELEDAIRDMLDFTVGWCRANMTNAEKFEAIRSIGEKVLDV